MKNAAGDTNCDSYIKTELEQAGIQVIDLESPLRHSEVPTRYQGFLNGWNFARAWYYWIASAQDTLLPFDIADKLHETHGKEIRVSGHCGCPAPREWYNKPWHFGVTLYHVDTQDGLTALAKAILEASAAHI